MDLEKIKQFKAQQALDAKDQALLKAISDNSAKVVGAISSQSAKQANDDRVRKVEVTNQPKVEVKHTIDFSPLIAKLGEVKSAVDKVAKDIVIPESEKTEEVSVNNLNDYSEQLAELITSVKNIDVKPQVNVTVPEVEVPEANIDLTPITAKLDSLLKAIKPTKPEKIDFSKLETGISSVKSSIDSLSFPIPNYVLPFKDINGNATQVQLNGSGNLPVSATIDTTGLATSTKQSDGTQKTQVVDGAGNVIGATSNALDVNIKSGASSGTQYADGAVRGTATGTLSMGDDGTNIQSVKVDSSGVLAIQDNGGSITVDGTVTANAGTNLNTSALALETGGNLATVKTNTDKIPALGQALAAASVPVVLTAAQLTTLTPPAQGLTDTQLRASAVPVSAASLPLPTGAATAAKQPALGTAGTASADVITVQGKALMTPVLTDGSATTQPVSGTFWQATQPVSLASVPSHAVTNAGTFAVQATLAANQSVNNAQINGVTPLMGNGVTGTGSQRVTIASDNTAFSVNSTLSAETTKVIGVTRTADGSGNLLTSTGSALDVNLKTSAATNISTNLAQVNGVTTLAGNGVSGTGAQRVTLASDSTGQVAVAANATATGTAIYNNNALSSTKQAVKASAGNLYGYHIYNPNTVVIYIQMFNVASASVTVGTTAPTMVLAVPAGGWVDSPTTAPGIAFGTALVIAATTTATGSTAPTTALVCNIWYL